MIPDKMNMKDVVGRGRHIQTEGNGTTILGEPPRTKPTPGVNTAEQARNKGEVYGSDFTEKGEQVFPADQISKNPRYSEYEAIMQDAIRLMSPEEFKHRLNV